MWLKVSLKGPHFLPHIDTTYAGVLQCSRACLEWSAPCHLMMWHLSTQTGHTNRYFYHDFNIKIILLKGSNEAN